MSLRATLRLLRADLRRQTPSLTPAMRAAAEAIFDPIWCAQTSGIAQGSLSLDDYMESAWRLGGDPHPLFSSRWYIADDPAVGLKRVCPFVHYLTEGEQEGRRASPYFAAPSYREHAGETIDPAENALAAYLQRGEPAGHQPCALFDPAWYATQAGLPSPRGAFAHYATTGWRRGLDPHPLFDVSWYRARYPDIPDQLEPLGHYITAGWRDNRRPNPLFNPLQYRTRYPDIAFEDPLEHFVLHGEEEARRATFLFDAHRYVAQNPAAREAPSLLGHYLHEGWRQGFEPNDLFDSDYYRAQSGDIPHDMSPIAHYELYGQARDLNPGPYLDAAWYRSEHAHMTAGDMSPLEHYLQAGMFEGLEPSPPRPETIDWQALSPVVVPLAADPNDRNVAIIASHDRREIYGTAVEHLVAGFKDAGWLVVLALDHPVDAAVYTTTDASRRPDAVLACDHQGYDFLSWRMAWEVLPDLHSARGVMLFNDSVLGPLAPLDHLTGALEAHTADFIGLVESSVPAPHIQSWGVYAKGRALAENGLGRHLLRAAPSTPKSVIIARLEIGSARFFRDAGCAVASVVSPTSMEFPDHNPSVIDAWSVLNAGVPFVKREALTLLDKGRLAVQHDPRAHLNDQPQERLAGLYFDSISQVRVPSEPNPAHH